MTTCDDLCDECDHQLTNLVGHNIKKIEKKNCPKVKSMGKSQDLCFWMFSSPLITILVSIFPEKNLDQALANLSIFAVQHCSPNNSFHAFFKCAQCRNAYFGDFVSKSGWKCGRLTLKN